MMKYGIIVVVPLNVGTCVNYFAEVFIGVFKPWTLHRRLDFHYTLNGFPIITFTQVGMQERYFI